MTVSVEGRVENQKRNQTAAQLSFGWVFGFQLDLLEKNLVSLAGFPFTFFFHSWVRSWSNTRRRRGQGQCIQGDAASKSSKYRWWYDWLRVSTGRVIKSFLVNRVEYQKLNQTTAELPFGWVFGIQLGLRQTQALIRTYYIIIIKEDEHKEEEVKNLNVHILLLLIMMM